MSGNFPNKEDESLFYLELGRGNSISSIFLVVK